MNTLEEYAAKIPANYRRRLLEENWIAKAVTTPNDEMLSLIVIWKDYLEPTFVVTCNSCYTRVMEFFKGMQPILIELERQNALLKEVI